MRKEIEGDCMKLRDMQGDEGVGRTLRASSAFFRISFPTSLQLLKRVGLCFKGSAVLPLMSMVTLNLGNGPKGGRLFAALLASFCFAPTRTHAETLTHSKYIYTVVYKYT
jgi:hypothetical protein